MNFLQRTRRNLLKLAAAAAVGAICKPVGAKNGQGFLYGPKRFYRGCLYTPGKRTTLFMTGASDLWGVGLDQTQHYTATMQAAIDTTCGSPKGGWTARNIHADDLQPGFGYQTGGAYAGYNLNPFNCESPGEGPNNATGAAGPTYGSASAAPYINNSLFAGSTGLNPQGGFVGTPTNSVQSSKLNWVQTAGFALPTAAQIGSFSQFTGARTSSSGSANVGNYEAPALTLQSTGQNIRWAAATSASNNALILGLIGNGTITIYGPGSLTSGVNITNTSTSSITLRAIAPFSAPVTSYGSASNFSAVWLSGGPVTIAVLWPTTNPQLLGTDMSVQVHARDSHCIQDWIGMALNAGAIDSGVGGTGANILNLMFQSALNNPLASFNGTPNGTTYYAPPIFLLQDTIANFVINGNAAYGTPDLRLTPSQYATALQTMGRYLQSLGPCQIILEMPCEASSASNTGTWSILNNSTYPNTNPSTGYGWITGYGQIDYQRAISAVAEQNNWYFLDQTQGTGSTILSGYPSAGQRGIASTTTQYFWQPDGVHMTTIGSSLTGTFMVGALGL